MPDAPYIIQKYADRAAFLVTENCFARCAYCFREDKLKGDSAKPITLKKKIKTLCDFLSRNKEISEIVITGGDPLILNDKELEDVFSALSRYKLRLHTRAPVYAERRITKKCAGLIARYKVKLVIHVVHPYEIDDIFKNAVSILRERGVLLFAQYPLLRGINDNAEVQKRLIEELVLLGIRPLSIFIVEPNSGSEPFRISWSRIEEIAGILNTQTPSWINSLRFVLDTEIGKVRMENFARKEPDGTLVFERNGMETRYPDFPPEEDVPCPVSRLLWKG